MSEALKKSSRKTSRDTTNAISSQESADGALLYDSQAYQTTMLFGQAAAPVNRFRAPESGKDTKTPDTYGPHSAVSFASAALQLSLESRLIAATDVNGSPEYRLTWKRQDMPRRAPLLTLRASRRRTSANASTGWPTAQAFDASDCSAGNREARTQKGGCANLREYAHLAGWPTASVVDVNNDSRSEESAEKQMERVNPMKSLAITARMAGWTTSCSQDGEKGGPQQGIDRLPGAAGMAGWTTPDAQAMNDGEGLDTFQARQEVLKAKHNNGNGAGMPIAVQAQLVGWGTECPTDHKRDTSPGTRQGQLAEHALMAGWSTPRAQEARQHNSRDAGEALSRQAEVAGWARPSSNGSAGEISSDLERAGEKWRNRKTGRMLQTNLATDALNLVSGTPPDGTTAETGSTGAYRLNPLFSLWLQGYPAEWASCGARAMRLCQKSRRRSSAPPSEP